jgi:hypothetical protein
LANIFANTINPENAHPASHAFWAIHSFQQKLAVTSAVIEAALSYDQKILKDWSKLSGSMTRQNKLRNKLAHGSVIGFSYRFEGERKEDLFFEPFYNARRDTVFASHAQSMDPKYDPRSKERLYASDLKEAAKNFIKLQGKLEAFCEQVRIQREQDF